MKPSFTVDSSGIVTGSYNFYVDGNILTPDGSPDNIIGMIWDGRGFSVDESKLESNWKNSEVEVVAASHAYRFSEHPDHNKHVAYMRALLVYDGTGDRPEL